MKQNKILYLILSQSSDDISVVFASFSKIKRDKIFKEKWLPFETGEVLFYRQEIILDKE